MASATNPARDDLNPSTMLRSALRVPGRCLSLIYIARRPPVRPAVLGADPARIVPGADLPQPVAIRAGSTVFSSFLKFESKLLWAKLLLLLIGRRFWLATTARQVVGLVGVRRDRLSSITLAPGEACIYSVLVVDEFRGHRLGLALVQAATLQLFADGCQSVLLETGEHNKSMIHLLTRSPLFQFSAFTQRPVPLPTRRVIL